MSKVAIAGNASGTGTLTIAAPNTDTDYTLTLPDEAGTVLTSASTLIQNSGPAFKAYRSTSAFSFSSGTWSKVQFQTEEYDTANCYDPSTNSRFTPNVGGYYIVTISINLSGASSPTTSGVGIYKNGNAVRYGPVNYFTVAPTTTMTGTCLVYLNGSSDYIEGFVYSNGTSPSITAAQDQSFFEACLIRAA